MVLYSFTIGGSVALKLAQRSRLAAAGTLAMALALTACSSGEESFKPSEDVSTIDGGVATSIDEAVESAMSLSHSTEAIVGVWTAEGEYLQGYGDVSGGVRFRAAQTSQPLMCALLLDAVGKGELSLDRKVQEDIPRQTRLDDVTYEQLCTGRSGIADFKSSIVDSTVNNPTRIWPDQELIAQGMARTPRSWPGLDFHRSDTNAVVLGRAFNVMRSENLQQQLDERVFSVADMPGSYFPGSTSLTVSGDTMTTLTFPSRNGKPVCDAEVVEVEELSPSMLGAAGSAVTTATDLKNFYEHYLSGGFGGEGATGLVTSVAPTKNPERDDEGVPVDGEQDELSEEEQEASSSLMWGFGTEKVGPLHGMAGKITGTISASYHDPDTGYTVVVALNNSSAGAGFAKALALEIAAISGPEVPWTAEDQTARLAKAAVCQ